MNKFIDCEKKITTEDIKNAEIYMEKKSQLL